MQNRPSVAEWSAMGIIQTGDYGHLGWEVSVEVMRSDSILGMFLRDDRLSSAGTFHPSSGVSSPHSHSFPSLWPRKLTHTDGISPGFPLGLPLRGRRQGEHEDRILFSLLPAPTSWLCLNLRLQPSPTVTLSGLLETFPTPPSFTPRGDGSSCCC